jgi:hypothetical protein
MMEHLPYICKTLNLITSTTNKKCLQIGNVSLSFSPALFIHYPVILKEILAKTSQKSQQTKSQNKILKQTK